ncbi:hypothetical protein B0H17DRAFT_1137149 [Mycena rosella]|uniref:Uncharacterized protein n=1 Tax=Mycena rosella TaxID=1033263 RepID=A0AAD7GDS2_MYCRO|nr:hypothetical protein B0H17DRAFT_1137149 [Mycena rosella]
MLPVSTTYDSLAARTTGNSTAEEAPVVYAYQGQWYLFTSWNKDDQTYETRVARYDGGYVGPGGLGALESGGGLILGNHDSVLGPGGIDTFLDDDGQNYLVYPSESFIDDGI